MYTPVEISVFKFNATLCLTLTIHNVIIRNVLKTM